MQTHTAARMDLYKYEIQAISVIYLPSPHSALVRNNTETEGMGQELRRNLPAFGDSKLRLPVSSGTTQVFGLTA